MMEFNRRLCRLEDWQMQTMKDMNYLFFLYGQLKGDIQANKDRIMAEHREIEEMKQAAPHHKASKRKLSMAAALVVLSVVLMTNELKDVTEFVKALGGLMKAF